jgi:hypothetical protein
MKAVTSLLERSEVTFGADKVRKETKLPLSSHHRHQNRLKQRLFSFLKWGKNHYLLPLTRSSLVYHKYNPKKVCQAKN